MVFRPTLRESSEEPLYRQLAGYFEGLIASGELGAGERLPATRELAGQLNVNRTTISAAYELLEAEGLISGQVGRGSFVLPRSTSSSASDWSSLLSRPATEPHQLYATAAPINFAASRPPEELFPLADFRRSCEEVLSDRCLGSLLQLGPAGGFEPLRQYLLEEADREQLLGADDDVLITSGCQQALDLLRRVLIRPSMRVAVEDPVYPGLRNVLTDGGAELVGLRQVADLSSARAAVAVVTPSFQNPTGLSLSLQAREQLLRDAADARTIVVENDIYSALRYRGEPLPTLKQLARKLAGGSPATVLLRSFSKIAFPGLRLGWAIGPRPLIEAMRQAKQLTDLHSDQFSQAVMLRFGESGRLKAHVEQMIQSGRERLDGVMAALERHMPKGTVWTRPLGGLNLWVTLPGELDAAFLWKRAYSEGVSYVPGSVFAVSRPALNSFRLSFGGAAPDHIQTGIRILGDIFKSEKESQRWVGLQAAPALV